MRITPRVGFRVGPAYVGFNLFPTTPARQRAARQHNPLTTRHQTPTGPTYRPRRPIYPGPYAAPLATPRGGSILAPSQRLTEPHPVQLMHRPAQANLLAAYGPATLHRATMQRQARQASTYRAGMSPAGRAVVALALVLVGGFLATMLLGMIGLAMGIVPATPSSGTHSVSPRVVTSAPHSVHTHTAAPAARASRR